MIDIEIGPLSYSQCTVVSHIKNLKRWPSIPRGLTPCISLGFGSRSGILKRVMELVECYPAFRTTFDRQIEYNSLQYIWRALPAWFDPFTGNPSATSPTDFPWSLEQLQDGQWGLRVHHLLLDERAANIVAGPRHSAQTLSSIALAEEQRTIHSKNHLHWLAGSRHIPPRPSPNPAQQLLSLNSYAANGADSVRAEASRQSTLPVTLILRALAFILLPMFERIVNKVPEQLAIQMPTSNRLPGRWEKLAASLYQPVIVRIPQAILNTGDVKLSCSEIDRVLAKALQYSMYDAGKVDLSSPDLRDGQPLVILNFTQGSEISMQSSSSSPSVVRFNANQQARAFLEVRIHLDAGVRLDLQTSTRWFNEIQLKDVASQMFALLRADANTG